MATTDYAGRVRPLHSWEIEEARLVFGDRLHYANVRVHECSTWTDALHHLRLRLTRQPIPPDLHNAVTLGNHCHFPVPMPPSLDLAGSPLGINWLIHEITHAWQYQRMGWLYLLKAIGAQIRLGEKAYDFGGAEGLNQRRREGWTIHHFNLEQQGAIAQTFYYHSRAGHDVSAWLPYIEDIQTGITRDK